MSLADVLRDLTRVFLDTAPIIYYFESSPEFGSELDGLFDRLDQGSITAVTSPVTLAETLVHPFRDGSRELLDTYRELIVFGEGVEFASVDEKIAIRASEIRAIHNIKLLDAMQLATAIEHDCEAFLTNDAKLTRVSGLSVFVLREL